MSEQTFPLATVGIVGAGQLGLMLCDAARRLGIATFVLADREDDPALRRADAGMVGDRMSATSLSGLSGASDVVTFEIEHADTTALAELESQGHIVRPSAASLATIRDKWLQRRALEDARVPGPRSLLWDRGTQSDEGSGASFEAGKLANTSPPLDYPVVQKLRTGGYDGRGVAVLRTAHSEPLPGESLVEELVDIRAEVSVIVARSPSGEERSYPPVLMEFDRDLNICTRCVIPSGLSTELERRAQSVALEAVRALDVVGVCAVELFISQDNEVLVNELAPRPHNSGHLTIEASATSQFEQHLRAILDLPLGDTATLRPAVMVNLLGAGGAGVPTASGLDELLALPEVHLHLYDKRPCKPGRKMGHLTICGESVEEARERAEAAQRVFTLYGKE